MVRENLRSTCVAVAMLGLLTAGSPSSAQAQTAAEIEAALKAAFTKYQNLKEGKKPTTSRARQGRPERLRHRPGHGRRQGLHDGRHQDRGVDPVDLESVHDGAGDGGVRGRGDSRRHGHGRHGRCSTRSSRWSSQGRRDERDGEPRRDQATSIVAARHATRSGRRSSAATATSPGGRCRSTRKCSSRSRTPTSVTRPSRC